MKFIKPCCRSTFVRCSSSCESVSQGASRSKTVSRSWFCPYTTLVLEIELRLLGLAPNASLAELTGGVFRMLLCYIALDDLDLTMWTMLSSNLRHFFPASASQVMKLQACATVCVCSSLKTVSQEPSPSPGASPSLHSVLGPGLAATCILSFFPHLSSSPCY